MRVSILNQRFTAAVVAAAALMTSACGEVARTGRSPGYLIIDSLEGAAGIKPDEFVGNVLSDVITNVKVKIGETETLVPTVFNDVGRGSFRIGLKSPGPSAQPTKPSPLNAITITRYRIVFKRTDGRNTQGVDVPYAVDGGMTITVPENGTAQGVFDLVRHAAKDEAPLRALRGNGGAQVISTIADITFFGADQAGNEVSVTGSLSVTFADFGDPQ